MSATNLTQSEKIILGADLTKHNSYLSDPNYVKFFDTCISPAAVKLDELKARQPELSYKQRLNSALMKEVKSGRYQWNGVQ